MANLSLIIPTFNSAKSIDRCLASIRQQTFKDFEVVIQDGLSADDTLDRVAAFGERHKELAIRVFQGRDGGAYDAMNRGIANAEGKWVLFLGCDDELYRPDSLSSAMGLADSGINQVLYGNVKVIGEAGWAYDGAIYDGPFNLKKLLIRNICHQAIFYRADLLRRVGGFNQDYFVCADWDLNLRCWAQTKFKYIDVIVANFYAGGISAGRRYDSAFFSDFAGNVIKYFDLSEFSPVLNTPEFAGYEDILRLQEADGQLRYMLGRASLYLQRRFGK